MRLLGLQIIEDNPFAAANKSHTLEKIKEELRQRTGEPFARDAWMTFWSSAYFESVGWQPELAFWNEQIRPLMESNYFRKIGKFGHFIDYFWLLDLPFVIIFALDFLTRIISIKRRHQELNWFEAMLRRWYDLFLLLPFWRSWRVLPVLIRSYHVNFLNLEPVRAEIQRDLLISLAAELTEMVGVRVIEQMQHSILSGEALRNLFEPDRQPYLDINGKDEVQSLTNRLIQVSVYDVIPQVQPDIEALVYYSISSTLKQIPLYQELQNVPGFNRLPSQIANNLAKSLSRIAYNNLTNVLEDPVAAEITARLSNNFREAFERELFQKHNIQEIKTLFVDLLEEIKINYIKGIEEVGIEQLMDEAERLKYKVDVYAKI